MNDFVIQTLRLLSFSDANVRFVFFGMALLGFSGGLLGSFTLLRKRALIGDALAHAALPGIGIAFLITGTKTTGVLLIGAYVAGVLGVLVLLAIRKFSRVKEDSALAIVLTVFFGIGIVILTFIQKSGKASQSGLDKFLFGQSASLVAKDVLLIGAVSLILLIAIMLFFKELKLLCFDPAYASASGLSSTVLDVLLMALVVGAVVIGLQAVGVVLMAALLIIPPVTARFWTDRLGTMVILSALAGAVSGALGSYFSFLTPRMPSGPLTVLAATSIFLISVFISPRRGILFVAVRRYLDHQRIARENTLRAIAELNEINNRKLIEPFSIRELAEQKKWNSHELVRHLKLLKTRNFIKKLDQHSYKLTETGLENAITVLKRHRLWETYLVDKAEIAPDHVHRDADESEHYITKELEGKIREAVKIDENEIQSPHPATDEVSTDV